MLCCGGCEFPSPSSFSSSSASHAHSLAGALLVCAFGKSTRLFRGTKHAICFVLNVSWRNVRMRGGAQRAPDVLETKEKNGQWREARTHRRARSTHEIQRNGHHSIQIKSKRNCGGCGGCGLCETQTAFVFTKNPS